MTDTADSADCPQFFCTVMPLNIGIFAHVDAGKTTLTERLLSESGAIRTAGRVDDGTAHTDTLPLEKARGISIRSACAGFCWNGQRINLVDAPGHADFFSEIERALWAVDIAVLVVSGTDGVQPQTEVLMQMFQKRHLPVVFFVNKLDRDTADYSGVLTALRGKYPGCFCPGDPDDCVACAAEFDAGLLEPYFAGEDVTSRVNCTLKSEVLSGSAFPVLGGSALTGAGVRELLNALTEYCEQSQTPSETPVSGIVFAVSRDRSMGRAAWVRLFSGVLRTRSEVTLAVPRQNAYAAATEIQSRKITCIRQVGIGGIGSDTNAVCAGDIAAVYGLGDVKAGQVIGVPDFLPPNLTDSMKPALYFAAVHCEDKEALRAALEELSAEDPALGVSVEEDGINIRLMGAVQLEVLCSELKSRFGLSVSFGPHKTVYRETIRTRAEGYIAYTMPKPCWAIIRFLLEPAPRGSGISFESRVSPRDIKPRYQHQIRQALPTALSQGMLGWQVDDVRITLIGGGDHEVHTHPLDFIVATPMAIMDGLRNAGPVLLEPLIKGEFLFPAESLGRIITLIVDLHGQVLETVDKGDRCKLTAVYPAREADDLPERFARLTRGHGLMNVHLDGYRECEITPERTRVRRGVDPLDTARYILAARAALDGDIFG